MGKAVEQGDVRAMQALAELNMMVGTYSGADMNMAVDLFKKLAYDHKEPDAMVTLGIFYCNGEHITRDAVKGMKLVDEGVAKLGDNLSPYLSLQLVLMFWDGKNTAGGNPDSRTVLDGERTVEFLEKAIAGGIDDENIRGLLDAAKGQLAAQKEMIKVLNEANRLLIETEINGVLDKLDEGLRQVEEAVFGEMFNAKRVKEDLQNRKSLEMLEEAQRKNLRDIKGNPAMMNMVRSMGRNTNPSRSTSMSLYENKNFFNENFDQMNELVTTIKGHLKTAKEKLPDSVRVQSFLDRSEKCEKELSNLCSIVRSF